MESWTGGVNSPHLLDACPSVPPPPHSLSVVVSLGLVPRHTCVFRVVGGSVEFFVPPIPSFQFKFRSSVPHFLLLLLLLLLHPPLLGSTSSVQDPAGEFEQAQLAFFASWVSHDPFVIARELRKFWLLLASPWGRWGPVPSAKSYHACPHEGGLHCPVVRRQFHEVGARGSVISIHEGRALTVDLSPAYPQGNEIFKRAVAEILAVV